MDGCIETFMNAMIHVNAEQNIRQRITVCGDQVGSAGLLVWPCGMGTHGGVSGCDSGGGWWRVGNIGGVGVRFVGRDDVVWVGIQFALENHVSVYLLGLNLWKMNFFSILVPHLCSLLLSHCLSDGRLDDTSYSYSLKYFVII